MTPPTQSPTVLLLSTSDTDLITARASGADYRWANPSRLIDGELDELVGGADVVVVRILGGYRAWQDGIDALEASGVPMIVVSGEQSPDAELMGHSTTPAGVALQAHVYLANGGVENLRQLHAFLCDTVLMTGFGFAPPVTTPNWGVLEHPSAEAEGPTVAVLYYRAQHLAGNTGYVEALCTATFQELGRRFRDTVAGTRVDLGLLRRLISGYVAFALENPDEYQLTFMVSHAMLKSPQHKDLSQPFSEQAPGLQAFTLFREQVARMVAAGAMRRMDVTVATQTIWAACHGLVALLIARPEFPWADRKQLLDTMVETLVRGLENPRR